MSLSVEKLYTLAVLSFRPARCAGVMMSRAFRSGAYVIAIEDDVAWLQPLPDHERSFSGATPIKRYHLHRSRAKQLTRRLRQFRRRLRQDIVTPRCGKQFSFSTVQRQSRGQRSRTMARQKRCLSMLFSC